MNNSLSVQGQLELEDIIFFLVVKHWYTTHHLKCSSPIENAYNLSNISKKVQNTKVVFGKSTEPSQSKEGVSKKVTITIKLSAHEEKIDFSTDQFSTDQKIESLSRQSQSFKSGNANAVVREHHISGYS